METFPSSNVTSGWLDRPVGSFARPRILFFFRALKCQQAELQSSSCCRMFAQEQLPGEPEQERRQLLRRPRQVREQLAS